MTDEMEQRAREVAGARDPVAALGAALPSLTVDAAMHLIESVFHRLPAYADAGLLRTIAAAYAADDQPIAAALIAGMANQIGHIATLPSPPADEPDEIVRTILAEPNRQAALQRELQAAEADPDRVATLLLRVWPLLPPVIDFWIVFRARKAFEAAGPAAADRIMAAMALQLAPTEPRSLEPMTHLLRALLARGRGAAAGALATEWAARCGNEVLNAELRQGVDLAAAIAPLPPLPTLGPWQVVHGPGTLPAAPAVTDASASLRSLGRDRTRDPVRVARLTNVEVVVEHDHVAVFEQGGAPIREVWFGLPPMVTRARAATAPTIGRTRAVLTSDTFPTPNYCHFLYDHVTRLTTYAQAGIAIDRVSVIGPPLAKPYQHEIAERFGAGEWIGTDRPRRIRVGELWIASTCMGHQHPAHLGADWARAAIRNAFGVKSLGGDRRLYVSRSDASARRVVNETALIDQLSDFGFELVINTDWTAAKQAEMFSDASHVVGMHGAGMANIVFCPPGCHVLELANPHYATDAFAILAQTSGLDYELLQGRDSGPARPSDPTDRIKWIGRDIEIGVDAVVEWARRTAVR